MNFFDFEAVETIDEEFNFRMNVEPVGTQYKYSLIFENSQSHFQYEGVAKNAIMALTKLRNILVSAIDSMSDSVEIVKTTAAHLAAYNDSNNDENGNANGEDDAEV